MRLLAALAFRTLCFPSSSPAGGFLALRHFLAKTKKQSNIPKQNNNSQIKSRPCPISQLICPQVAIQRDLPSFLEQNKACGCYLGDAQKAFRSKAALSPSGNAGWCLAFVPFLLVATLMGRPPACAFRQNDNRCDGFAYFLRCDARQL